MGSLTFLAAQINSYHYGLLLNLQGNKRPLTLFVSGSLAGAT
jgi:hypothetical protein